MTTNVAITFDIEFDINGAFLEPASRRPLGREAFSCSKSQLEPTGLDKILECLAAHDTRATFFMETLQSAWFGLSEMGDLAHKIRDGGHELQLHLHPVWLIFDNDKWRETVIQQIPESRIHDSLAAVSSERACEIITRGLDVFKQWELPPPTAIRTGSLITERQLYKVFSHSGLNVSSSVGLGIYQPSDPELHLLSSARQFDGVTELPVTSYFGADPFLRRQRRLATLVGMGQWEQTALLRKAKEAAAPFVILLSHVSEFFVTGARGVRRPYRLTAKKLARLCDTIQKDPALRAVTIDELAHSAAVQQSGGDKALSVSRTLSALRFAEHALL